MRTIEVKLFQFDELSDEAKEKARDWYREGDDFDSDYMFESFVTAAQLLGITFATRDNNPDIRYSGFCSQGDGASFVGSYEFAKGCAQAIRKEFPEDKTLHRIADELTVLQSRTVLQSGSCNPIEANITQSGSYVHKMTMDLEVINRDDENGEVEFTDDKELLELMRDFAQWMYDSLETEYDYQMSNEAVDGNITANEYEFTEEGEIK